MKKSILAALSGVFVVCGALGILFCSDFYQFNGVYRIAIPQNSRILTGVMDFSTLQPSKAWKSPFGVAYRNIQTYQYDTTSHKDCVAFSRPTLPEFQKHRFAILESNARFPCIAVDNYLAFQNASTVSSVDAALIAALVVASALVLAGIIIAVVACRKVSGRPDEETRLLAE